MQKFEYDPKASGSKIRQDGKAVGYEDVVNVLNTLIDEREASPTPRAYARAVGYAAFAAIVAALWVGRLWAHMSAVTFASFSGLIAGLLVVLAYVIAKKPFPKFGRFEFGLTVGVPLLAAGVLVTVIFGNAPSLFGFKEAVWGTGLMLAAAFVASRINRLNNVRIPKERRPGLRVAVVRTPKPEPTPTPTPAPTATPSTTTT